MKRLLHTYYYAMDIWLSKPYHSAAWRDWILRKRLSPTGRNIGEAPLSQAQAETLIAELQELGISVGSSLRITTSIASRPSSVSSVLPLVPLW
jgi:hypothetical protein